MSNSISVLLDCGFFLKTNVYFRLKGPNRNTICDPYFVQSLPTPEFVSLAISQSENEMGKMILGAIFQNFCSFFFRVEIENVQKVAQMLTLRLALQLCLVLLSKQIE